MIAHGSSLHHFVADFISEVKSLCPKSIVEVSYQPYETEDAHIVVHAPLEWSSEQCEHLAEHLAEMHCKVLLDTGLSIPVLVIEPQEQP